MIETFGKLTIFLNTYSTIPTVPYFLLFLRNKYFYTVCVLSFIPYLVYKVPFLLFIPFIVLVFSYIYNDALNNKPILTFSKLRVEIIWINVIFMCFNVFFLIIPFMKKKLENYLDFLMATGWDLVGHFGLYSFQASFHEAVGPKNFQHLDYVSHYMMPGYPNLWHSVFGNISSLFFTPFSIESLKFFVISTQFTYIFSVLLLLISTYNLLQPKRITTNTKIGNYLHFIFVFLFCILAILFSFHYSGIWTFVGWVNWPIAVGLFFYAISLFSVNKVEAQIDKILIILFLLPMLYPSIYVFLLIFITIYLLLNYRNKALKILRNSKLAILYPLSILVFSYLLFITPKGMLLDDGGGVRITFLNYIILAMIVILILFTKLLIFKSKFRFQDSSLIITWLIIYLPFLIVFIYITEKLSRQPYGFSKLGTVFFALGILLLVWEFYKLLKMILIINFKPKQYGEYNFLFISQVIIINIILIFLSSFFTTYSKSHTNFFLNNILAFKKPELIIDSNWYTGKDILKVNDLSFEKRILNGEIKLFVGKYPYLANMWLSLIRPNDVTRSWGQPISWIKNPDKYYNYINYFSTFADFEKIKLGLQSDESLFLYSKIENCNELKKSLPINQSNRLICI